MLFVHPLLNNLIKDAIYIFSMQRLGAILHFKKRKIPNTDMPRKSI
jgi:hypothetical protein